MTDEPPRCPYCWRVISYREYDEQAACDDCYTGPPVDLVDVLDRLPADARDGLTSVRRGRMP